MRNLTKLVPQHRHPKNDKATVTQWQIDGASGSSDAESARWDYHPNALLALPDPTPILDILKNKILFCVGDWRVNV